MQTLTLYFKETRRILKVILHDDSRDLRSDRAYQVLRKEYEESLNKAESLRDLAPCRRLLKRLLKTLSESFIRSISRCFIFLLVLLLWSLLISFVFVVFLESFMGAEFLNKGLVIIVSVLSLFLAIFPAANQSFSLINKISSCFNLKLI